jgi:hypothetical protein
VEQGGRLVAEFDIGVEVGHLRLRTASMKFCICPPVLPPNALQ